MEIKKIVFGKADLHIHSKYSDDSSASIKNILNQAKKKKLNVIAITDHNTMNGVKEAQELGEKLGIDVIAGEEITTKEGHLIGLFLKEFISPNKSAIETIQEIHRQGGLAIIPHPDYPILNSISSYYLKEVFYKTDGIEILNSSAKIISFINKRQIKLKHLNKKIFKKAVIASSDAHFASHVGVCYTSFVGKTAEDLYQSIKKRTTSAKGGVWNYRDKMFYFLYILTKPLMIPTIIYKQIKKRLILKSGKSL